MFDLGATFDDYNRSGVPDLIAQRMDSRAVGGDVWLALALLALAGALAAARKR